MDLAKDLAWQKIFRGRSTNSKIEKSGFYYIFATLTPYFISFPDTQWAYKNTTENINIKRSLKRFLKKNLFFFLRFFLPFISNLTRKFSSFWSDNKLRERSNEQWKETNFFFYLLSDLLILIFSVVILYAYWVSRNAKNLGSRVAKMQKKTRFFNFQIRWATSIYFLPG